MKFLFLLLKTLASINVCIAFNSSVGELSDVRPISHSFRQKRSPPNEAMEMNDKATDGKNDISEEERLLEETVAKVWQYLEHASFKENTGLYEKLLHEETGNAEHLREANDLLAQVIRGYSRKGPRLMEVLEKLQQTKEFKQFADTTLVTMFKNPKTMNLVVDAWIASEKTPSEVSAFLLQHVKGQEWIDFVNSDLFNPWLTYVSRLYTELKSTEQDTTALAESVDKLFYTRRNAEEVNKASAKAGETADGKHVAALISTIRES